MKKLYISWAKLLLAARGKYVEGACMEKEGWHTQGKKGVHNEKMCT